MPLGTPERHERLSHVSSSCHTACHGWRGGVSESGSGGLVTRRGCREGAVDQKRCLLTGSGVLQGLQEANAECAG